MGGENGPVGEGSTAGIAQSKKLNSEQGIPSNMFELDVD